MGEVRYLKRSADTAHGIDQEVADSVRKILGGVREHGDEAIRKFTKEFDGIDHRDFRISAAEAEAATEAVSRDAREAIDTAITNVREFHREQRDHIEGFEREFGEGVTLGQRVLPIESAGAYVPGGRYQHVVTPVMTIVPAAVAGVERVIACTPPQEDGTIPPAQLYAMREAGADAIYSIGGAQAIGAMAYGTASVDSVDMVTGPGNVFTTEAKRQVFGTVGIDFLAGPTEVLIIADETADPSVIATDILAQAEHDINSRPVLISLSDTIARQTIDRIEDQLATVDSKQTTRKCWQVNGEVAIAKDRMTAIDLANEYAMEHLQVMTADPREYMDGLRNYGSLFLGHHSPVVFGDKIVGTNHCLPTFRGARYTSGIWVGTYLKTPTHQELTAKGAAELAPLTARLCELEGMDAHRRSAEARTKTD